MRLWSIHPSQLDHIALVAVWREGLLAKKVLEGNTKGYVNHPQLYRFRNTNDPLMYINFYLHIIFEEAVSRNYNFDRTKLEPLREVKLLTLTEGQLSYEWHHHLAKSLIRTPKHHMMIKNSKPTPHPLFILEAGPLEEWERVNP